MTALDRPLRPLRKQNFGLAGIDMVVNAHLHFDHAARGRIDGNDTYDYPIGIGAAEI